MAIERKVITEVICDTCEECVVAWNSDRTKHSKGVSKEWAKYFARKMGCTTGKEVICKSCRIEKRIASCSILKKHGIQDTTDGIQCLGFCKEGGEPIEQCKRCIAHTEYDWEEERRKIEARYWK